MGIRVLEEKHKLFAEMLLTGKPATMREKAERLGVDRTTLYNWTKDALFLKYLEKLSEELEQARVERMTPLVFTASEAVHACLRNALTALEANAKEDRAEAPGVTTLVGALKTLVELERVDRGKPSSIKRSETDDGKPKELDPASKRLLGWLDKLGASDEEDEATETHTAPQAAQH